MTDQFELLNQMEVITVNKFSHVVVPSIRKTEYIDNITQEPVSLEPANFNGTGKALCGVLTKGMTLEEFKKRWVDIKSKERYFTAAIMAKKLNIEVDVLKDYSMRNRITGVTFGMTRYYNIDEFKGLIEQLNKN